MSLVDALKGLLESPDVVHECRNCGTNVDGDRETCPDCGSDGIARYEIDDRS